MTWYLPAGTKMHLVYVNCINIINEMLCSPVELKKAFNNKLMDLIVLALALLISNILSI